MTVISSRTSVVTRHITTIDGQEVETTAPVAEFIDPYVSEDGNTVVVALTDDTGSTLSEYEWPENVSFAQGNSSYHHYHNDADKWLREHDVDGFDVYLVGVYEHGQIMYSVHGESVHSGDQFDYAIGAAIALPTEANEGYTDTLAAARAILAEYTAWCNGDTYGIARLERKVTYDLAGHEVLGDWVETDVVWGFLGSNHAQQVVNDGGY